MSSSQPSPTNSSQIHEGVFAINKPPSLTSAQVIRDAQTAFANSTLFAPWIAREKARRSGDSHNQRQKRRSWKQRQPVQVKIGHGGTLDPLATGVLILGIGSGTKALGGFLECTKSYETVVLFGAETDSYDVVGKVVRRAEWGAVTREKVEEALGRFRGRIMQKPPVFSALRVKGKRLYEYAREGVEVPVEIEERPVEVDELGMVEWMDGGTHEWNWPKQEVKLEEAEDLNDEAEKMGELMEAESHPHASGGKRKRDDDEDALNESDEVFPKRAKSSSPPPGLDSAPAQSINEPAAARTPIIVDQDTSSQPQTEQSTQPRCPAPAVRLRMTVTSGFYVRSLAHDLGLALDSAATMASLVRTRQGHFMLGTDNVLEYEDLAKGEQAWGPKVKRMLEAWSMNENGPSERERRGSRGGGGRSGRERARRRNSSSEKEAESKESMKSGERESGQEKVKRRNSSSDSG